ncbi:hypothetical protein PQB34_gp19 [Ochrobactrum phage POI1126]|nr:hypothetical protein [Brucella intermedia]YP_010665160.1 hypothetical protein PQB34_gp19 [Ochrobactrum phage POI1126]APU92947.1 hypothetical protein POI1126_19 [Ochrobactrum phage POI1126]SUA82079.1 Uncharacterised protein [Brucella intermedia]
MKNFGKMIETRDTVEIPPVQTGVDDDGKPIFAPAQRHPIRIFRNSDGVDWFEIAKQYPHPYYIAVDDDNRVVTMTDDFQQTQIAGYTIIGIDQNYGMTYGPGGNVYGKIWTGSALISPDPTVDDVVTERDRRLQLGFDYDFGDNRGVHHIGTTETDMRRWMDEVTPLAQAFINRNDQMGRIGIFTETGPVTITAAEWQQILIASADYRQPLYQASFVLQAMNPIPADYKDDKYWVNNQ